MVFETFSGWVAEFSAIVGIAMIVCSVVYTCFRVVLRNEIRFSILRFLFLGVLGYSGF